MWNIINIKAITLNVIFNHLLLSSCAPDEMRLNETEVRVYVTEGTLEGEMVANSYGGTFYSFRGIPYAEPPIGELRFKAPLSLKPWNGLRKAKAIQSSCITANLTSTEQMSEDCLYLNVYTPDLNPVEPLPVMFWIHGGGFILGSGGDSFYGPEFLVKEGVILVTINYRLGALGFLSLDSKDMPGNAGMKDQVAALRWVNNNIMSFGGDPDNITIFGESAGGASVGFHLVSPMSKGLFKRAIAQSGVSTCWWANTFQARERAIFLAKTLGFNSDKNEDLYEFFKSQPAENLIETDLPITYAEGSLKHFQLFYGVVSEMLFDDSERFFYGDVFDSLQSNVHTNAEIMVGYTEDEGYLDFDLVANLHKIFEQANTYLEFFVPPPITINNPLRDQIEVGRIIKDFYFGNKTIRKCNLHRLVNFSSSNIFVFWIIEWAKVYAKHKDNIVYLYKFTAKTERNIASRIFDLRKVIGDRLVAAHLDDTAYLFPVKGINPKMNTSSEEFKITESIVKLWTNFAKYGNPTPDDSLSVRWSPYTTDKQDYLEIGNEFIERNAPEEEEIQFLESVFKKYLPKCLGIKTLE